MPPSHSTPEKCQKTLHQIITLMDSFDNKCLLAYRDYVARTVAQNGYDGVLDNEYALLNHLIALKVTLQNARNISNELKYRKDKDNAA